MKKLYRVFAILGIAWAVAMPAFLFWQEFSDDQPEKLHVMAQDISGLLHDSLVYPSVLSQK
jgi:hypothetical protein